MTERLKKEAGDLVKALGGRALSSVHGTVQGTAGRLTEYVEGGGGPGIMAAVTGAKNLAEGKSPLRSMLGAGFAGVKEKVKGMVGKGGKGGGGRKIKVTNIVESIDVGAPVRLTYNQWTQWSDFPKFMKKVENVDQPKEEQTKTSWKAQVFWSHRVWEATIREQVPDDKIIWRSKGAKGQVDGAVTFHELAPNLTRILVVLEYHPQGMFERTGNIWRAQGRRARLELKHFRRHMMSEVLLNPDDIEGWRGTIHDGEVVESHEDAIAREEKERSQQPGAQQSGDGRADSAAEDSAEESSAEESSESTVGEDEEGDEQRRGSGSHRPGGTRGRREPGRGTQRWPSPVCIGAGRGGHAGARPPSRRGEASGFGKSREARDGGGERARRGEEVVHDHGGTAGRWQRGEPTVLGAGRRYRHDPGQGPGHRCLRAVVAGRHRAGHHRRARRDRERRHLSPLRPGGQPPGHQR